MSESHAMISTAFAGARRIACGPLPDVAASARQAMREGTSEPILVFRDANGAVIDIDYRGSPDEVRARLRANATDEADERQTAGPGEGEPETARRRGPGRPRLGVVAREVTLLPRHWEWLREQPGGASVALRKLVEEARRTHADEDRRRRARDAAYGFISVMAGDYPGFEEATRALFAGDAARFETTTQRWPRDVRAYAATLAAGWFAEGAADRSG